MIGTDRWFTGCQPTKWRNFQRCFEVGEMDVIEAYCTPTHPFIHPSSYHHDVRVNGDSHQSVQP
jgi:hypothetical protein